MKDIRIVELSEENVDETVKLIIEIFDNESSEFDYPRKWLPASLHQDSEEIKELYKKSGTIDVEYYVAIDLNKKVVGVTGYYTRKADYKNTFWLGWFAVSKEYRGTGLARELLDLIIKKAKKAGMKYLKLYTSDDEVERAAQVFYEKVGLKIKSTEPDPEGDEMRIYREMEL